MQSETPHDHVQDPTTEQIVDDNLVALTDEEAAELHGATADERAAFLETLDPDDLERRRRGLRPGDPDPESARVGEMTPDEQEEFSALPPDADRYEWLRERGLKGQTFRAPLGSPSGCEAVPRSLTPETVGGPPREEPPAPDASPEDIGDYRRRRAARATAARIVKDLQNRFTYHPPPPGQPELYQEIRRLCLDLALRLSTACPQSRELSLAYTHLEQTIMWANASIARAPAQEATPDQELEPRRERTGGFVSGETLRLADDETLEFTPEPPADQELEAPPPTTEADRHHTFEGPAGSPCRVCSWPFEDSRHRTYEAPTQ